MLQQTDFNEDISRWNTSNVKDMTEAFLNESFNQDISNWDTNVKNMRAMFNGADSFDKNLSNWIVCNVTDVKNGMELQGIETVEV